jgi:hypothetical protein
MPGKVVRIPQENTGTPARIAVASTQPLSANPVDTTHKVVTPVKAQKLNLLLQGYPEIERRFLIDGFTSGFRLQSHGPVTPHRSKNHGSAEKLPNVTFGMIMQELQASRIAGPFHNSPFPNLVISPLGLVPKKDGKHRLIHDLSSPFGTSVNDSIQHADSTVQYETLDDFIKLVKRFGTNALMAKCDIENAFRQIPVHRDDFHLLGFSWNGLYYYDKCLPMGCACSCQIFERFSRALQWILNKITPDGAVSHILDDFMFVGPAGSNFCLSQLHHFFAICESINLPIKHNKTVLPATCITVHGLQVSSQKMLITFPPDKLEKLTLLLRQFLELDKITLVEIQQLSGVLNFACKAILPGRAFSRRIISLTNGLSRPYHHVRVTGDAKADANAWLGFLMQFNGRCMFLQEPWIASDVISLYTDASGSHYAGVFGAKWFSGAWPPSWQEHHITVKELFPIVLAVQIWAPLWKNHKLMFFSDNMAVVDIINAQSSKDKLIMLFVRRLVLICLINNILFKSLHVPGHLNVTADRLSRCRFQEARLSAPFLDIEPTPIPPRWLPT